MSNVITLEEMEKMSDGEINEIAAVKVMGWKFKVMNGYKEDAFVINDELDLKFYSEWNPTNDINDAMQLHESILECASASRHFIGFLSQIINVTYADDTYNFVTKLMCSTARQRTIAAILAKEESQ